MRNFGGGYRTYGGKASGRTFDRHDFRGVVGPSRIRTRDPKVPVRDHRNGGYGQGGVSVRDAAQPRYCGKVANTDPRCQPSPRDHRASSRRR